MTRGRMLSRKVAGRDRSCRHLRLRGCKAGRQGRRSSMDLVQSESQGPVEGRQGSARQTTELQQCWAGKCPLLEPKGDASQRARSLPRCP